MSRNIIRQLKMLKHGEVNPGAEWMKSSRELLLSQIKNTVPAGTSGFHAERMWQAMSVFMPSSFVYKVLRPVMVVLLVIGMGIGSWIATVDASYEALPGDWLYSAKIATEKTQVAVATVVGAKNTETNLHVEFAKRRADETKKIINDPEKISLASGVVSDLKDEIMTVNNKLDEAKNTPDQSVSAEMAKNITQSAQQIGDVLKEVKVNLLVNVSSTENTDLTAQVSEVKDITKDTAIKAVDVMVTKHLQGDTSASKEEVKQAISDQLVSAVSDMAESKLNTEEVKKAVDAVKTESTALAAENKIANIAITSSSEAITSQIDAAVKQTQDAVDKTQMISSSTDKNIIETQQLLSQDNLSQALDKVKEATDATKEAEKIADNTIKAVQSVLPVVAITKDDSSSVTSTDLFTTTTPATSSTLSVSSTAKLISAPTIKAEPIINTSTK